MGNKKNQKNKPVGNNQNKINKFMINKQHTTTEVDDNPESKENCGICGQQA